MTLGGSLLFFFGVFFAVLLGHGLGYYLASRS